MNFKDFVAQDISKVFFNVDEFSKQVTIDGHSCVVQIDSERLIERADKEYGGVTAGLILYLIPVSVYPGIPKVENSQIFNNKLHYIDSIAESDGIYEIVINQNRGE